MRDVATQTEASAARSDAELIETILSGSGGAAELTALAGELASIPFYQRRAMAAGEIKSRFAVSESTARKLQALWELADRQAPDDRPAISGVADALHVLHQLRLAGREEVHAIFIDARNRLIATEIVAVGAQNAARLNAREVLIPALRHNASGIIIGHNHPSNDATPSPADHHVTESLKTAAGLVGLRLCDHIIMTRMSHYSFREHEEWDDSLAA